MKDLLEPATIIAMVHRATRGVMSTMLDMEAEPGDPYRESLAPADTEGVVSFVGLAGPVLAGTGSLRCSSQSACQFASRFLAAEFHAVDDEVLDAFGELTNMIVGSFKHELEEHIGPTGLSIPAVIYGRSFSTRSLGAEDWMVVPFLCGKDRLEVKICLKRK